MGESYGGVLWGRLNGLPPRNCLIKVESVGFLITPPPRFPPPPQGLVLGWISPRYLRNFL